MEVDLGQLSIVPVPKRKKGRGAQQQNTSIIDLED